MVAPSKSRVWKAYLPIKKVSRASTSDIAWFGERGVERETLFAALAVLRHVRKDVLPLLSLMECSFLVHDRRSGVPTKEGDERSFIDATFVRNRMTSLSLPRKWLFVRPCTFEDEGWSRLIDQSKWYFDFIASCGSASDVAVLRQIGQHLHYFSNMSQLIVR